ncbi:hypothetical protein [Chryseobacterium sp.]|uniref:hypothetical protein n=1 Tax=Chryseobacterium sp. TaxID=1871047 RepID=UPI0025B989A1|nr:hypothetical protein [Chryseobacterium sp.]MBV8328461.1 hypothetical protein [Chryseobacterium sp.]
MKKIYTSILLFIASLFSTQVPQAYTYQTIAFDSSGTPIANGNVSLKVSILDNTATGAILYAENHIKTTNSKGLVNLNIGQGTSLTGSFTNINWGTNPKFVKVELDPQGGTNYVNVGVNQLMSVPYSQVSKTVVTGPGQGITLVSPNGTHYTLNVNDFGTLNMPYSAFSTPLPPELYVYGSYNSFNPATAKLLRQSNIYRRSGYMYLPAQTEIKFINQQNASAQVYGADGMGTLVPNGSSYMANSNGFYSIYVLPYSLANPFDSFAAQITNFAPELVFSSVYGYFPQLTPATYNVATNTFTIEAHGVTNYSPSFRINLYQSEVLGDNLADGSLDLDGVPIVIPNTSATPKNYKITFTINFDATGTYTITEI